MATIKVNGKHVRCGNRKAHGGMAGSHASAAEVRDCYAGNLVNTTNGRGERESYRITPTPVNEWRSASQAASSRPNRQDALGRLRDSVPSTEAQRGYIADLRARKGLEPLGFTGTKAQASAEIDRLLAIPSPDDHNAHIAGARVPDGRYAVDRDGEVKFYRVRKGWLAVQASDNWYPVRSRQARSEVLAVIRRDPKAASLRYGRLIGSCGVCGRTLTDADSRARGIGPICADKTGW